PYPSKYKGKTFNRFKTVQRPPRPNQAVSIDRGPSAGQAIQRRPTVPSALDLSGTSDVDMQDASMIPDRDNPAQRQKRVETHHQNVTNRRAQRDVQTSDRAMRCKDEYQEKGFDRMPSKQYGIHVHCIDGIDVETPVDDPNDNSNLLDTPEDVEFKPFKPFDPSYNQKRKDPQTVPKAET
ncbi:hypothetical protein BGZ83_005378, partial [Gryganskiella cystojenkinii]